MLWHGTQRSPLGAGRGRGGACRRLAPGSETACAISALFHCDPSWCSSNTSSPSALNRARVRASRIVILPVASACVSLPAQREAGDGWGVARAPCSARRSWPRGIHKPALRQTRGRPRSPNTLKRQRLWRALAEGRDVAAGRRCLCKRRRRRSTRCCRDSSEPLTRSATPASTPPAGEAGAASCRWRPAGPAPLFRSFRLCAWRVGVVCAPSLALCEWINVRTPTTRGASSLEFLIWTALLHERLEVLGPPELCAAAGALAGRVKRGGSHWCRDRRRRKPLRSSF